MGVRRKVWSQVISTFLAGEIIGLAVTMTNGDTEAEIRSGERSEFSWGQVEFRVCWQVGDAIDKCGIQRRKNVG